MKTVPLPPRDPNFGQAIFVSLGGFWSVFYQDVELIKRYCQGSGLDAAQVYLDLIEAVNALGRNTIPVFHRERWLPLTIRRSQQNTGAALHLRFGGSPLAVFGAQPSTTEYTPGEVFNFGEAAVLGGMVAYPCTRSFSDGVERIHEAVLSPRVSLIKNVDFTVQENVILFTTANDPFANSLFPRRVIADPVSGGQDEEILLWATDALIDETFVADHFGYAIDYERESTVPRKNQVNALWDLRLDGSNKANLRSAIGKMLGIAFIGSAQETVEQIATNASTGLVSVITDKAVYTLNDGESPRAAVVLGAILTKGEFLTDTVKLYKLDPERFFAANGRTLEEFIADVPTLFLPRGVIGSYGLDTGFSVTWEQTDITFEGNDGNENPKLRFALGGTAEAVQSFWETIWQRAEEQAVDLSSFFTDQLSIPPPYPSVGQVVGTINPMEFYFKNFLKANAFVLVVDFTKLPAYITSLDILGNLRDVIPAHILLFLVGSRSIEEDPYDLETSVVELVNIHFGKSISEVAEPAGDPTETLIYEESVTMRWVPR